jgi:hypothetical protein
MSCCICRQLNAYQHDATVQECGQHAVHALFTLLSAAIRPGNCKIFVVFALRVVKIISTLVLVGVTYKFSAPILDHSQQLSPPAR